MQNQKVIEQLGYSPKEAKVYLASLSLGEAHISDIADKAKIPRSTAQVIVDRLQKDGLMNFYVMRRYKYWVAEKPERLLDMLKQREAIIETALPKLVAIRQESKKNRSNESLYKESLTLLKTCAETIYQPVLITTGDIEIVYVNSAWQKEFGYALEEVQGQNPRMFKSGKTPVEEYKAMWKALGSDKLFQSDRIIDKRKDGTHLNLLTTIFPVHHGNRRFYIQILSEITEKKEVSTLRQSFVDSTIED